MKRQLLTLLFTLFLANHVNAQSINFTSELTTAEIGTIIEVPYQYTIASAGIIYCAIELQDDFAYVSTVADVFLASVPAGTNVPGVFNLTIPASTIPTANLTGNLNYKIKVELRDSGNNYLAGEFPNTQINFTAATVTNAISFTGTPFTTAEIGSTVAIGYQYSLAQPGQIYCAIELQNGFTFVSTVVGEFLSPVAAGSNVPDTFNFLIPNTTVPTASLPSGQNYKLKIELRNSTGGYLTGQFPNTEINFTPNLSTSNFENNIFNIYPNPTNDFLNIKGIENTPISQVIIMDMLGKKVLATSQLDSNKIDVSNLKSGIYLMTISVNNIQKTIKFIKN